MAKGIRPRTRSKKLYIRFKHQGIEFYKQWGLADNPEHVARMEYICKCISQEVGANRFTDLEKYFVDAELWDWMKVCRAIAKKPENSTNRSLTHKLHMDHPRLNGPKHVKAWLDSMNIATATKARYLGAIKSVAPAICQGVSYSQKNKSEPNPFSQTEQDRIIECCDGLGFETYMLIDLWLHCGFRPGEARALTCSDFDPVSMKLSIKRSMTADGRIKSTKTGKSRVIGLPNHVATSLGRFVHGFNPGQSLFLSIKHHSNWTRRVWKPLLVRAGVKEDFRPYRLRHTAITAAVQRDPRRIALIAKEYGTSPAVIFEHYLGFIESSIETNPTT
ncbi:hypothetical protein D0962_35285 [Leptolyngbyaceae cyanobacterium CCMR0082]|uniref:Tyr recombinase domain-containing protein n=2 Tax=Adonisia TaxID=2950183 RepID=A0A6M0SIZ6_9CYAN|nr:hypothetical protein [Adonisia turfae CCMR0082]